MGADKVKYIWTLMDSPTRPTTHYAIEMWAEGYYDLGESLALFMGFLEPDPNRPGQTHIVAHNTVYADTGAGTQGNWAIAFRRGSCGDQSERFSVRRHPHLSQHCHRTITSQTLLATKNYLGIPQRYVSKRHVSLREAQ